MIGAYVSRLLARRLLECRLDDGFRSDELQGVLLYVDIAGSTALVENFAAAGPDGAERLGGVFSKYFGGIFDIVQAHGGDVVQVHGDAVLGLWRVDGDSSVQSALESAAHAAMCLRERRSASAETTDDIHERIALGGGSLEGFVLRTSEEQSFFVLSGPAIGTLMQTVAVADADSIVVAEALVGRLQDIGTFRRTGQGGWALESLQSPAELPATRADPDEEVPFALARLFVPRMIAERLAAGGATWLADFRVISMVYVHLVSLESATANRLHEAIQSIHEAITPLGVALFDVLVGDKGAVAQIACGVPPFSQERNAVRALEAARRVHKMLGHRGISASIGVSTGRAFCGDVGNRSRRECLLTGPVMHTGARLMQAAAGGILCDDETALTAIDHYRLPEPAQLAIKGRAEPLTVYRADLLEPTARGIGDHTRALHGRAEELSRVSEALDRMERGHSGVIVIRAEPGAGKSRLLSHVAIDARARGMSIAATATSSVELTTAYYACRLLLRALLLDSSDDPSTDDAALLRKRLGEALHGDPLEPKAALIEDILPLGIEDKGLAGQITGPARLTGIEEIFVRLASRRANMTPLVMLVDDVHWLDDPSARLLLALVRRVPRLLLALATRPLDDKAGPHVSRLVEFASVLLPLQRLERDAILSMLCELLGARSIPPDFGDYVYTHSEGLPFHAEQLAFSLRDQGVVRVVNGRCHVDMSQLSLRSIPHNLRDLIVSRIDALGAVHQAVVKVASAIGRTFKLDVLQCIFPMMPERVSLAGILADLADVGILEPGTTADGGVAFRHVLIKEATYELLTFEQRRPLHRRIGEFIEGRYNDDLEPYYAELADHFERAAEFAKAVDYREQAALLALRRYANHDALKQVDRIEAVAARGGIDIVHARAARLAHIRGDALHELTRFVEAQEQFKRCAALSGIAVPDNRARLVADATIETARQVLHRLGLMARPRAEARDKERLTAHIYTRFAEHAYFTGDALWLVHGTMTSLNHAERVGALAEVIEGYGGLAIGLGTAGLHRLARFYRDRSIERAEQEGSLHDQGFAHLLACVYSFQAGDWQATAMHCAKGAAVCQQIGDRFRYQSCRVIHAYMHILRGGYDAAEDMLKGLGEDADEVENIPVRAWVLAGRGIIDSIRGRAPATALGRLASARDDSLHQAERLLCDGLEAIAHLQNSDLDRAVATAQVALNNMIEHPPTMGCAYLSIAGVALVHLVVAENARARGQPAGDLIARASAACRAARTYRAKTPIFVPRGLLLDGRLALLRGNRRRAATFFRRALEEAKHRATPLEEALALLALGDVADTADAREECRCRGTEILRRIGARPWGQSLDTPTHLEGATA